MEEWKDMYKHAMWVPPTKLKPPHKPRCRTAIESITRGMRNKGWLGRPLFGVARKSYFKALTGSHRIHCAVSAGLHEVPIVLVDPGHLSKVAENTIRRGRYYEFYEVYTGPFKRLLEEDISYECACQYCKPQAKAA